MTSYVWSLLGYEIEPEPEPEPEIPDYSDVDVEPQQVDRRDSVLNQIKSLRLENDHEPIEIFKKQKSSRRKPHEFSWRDIASANPYSLEETNPGLL
jgi:hypothetical protein